MKSALGCVSAVLLLGALGIWFYLLYQVLAAVDASSAMWAAFWVYVPLSFLAAACAVVSREIEK